MFSYSSSKNQDNTCLLQLGHYSNKKSERMGDKHFYFWDPEDDGTLKQVTFLTFPMNKQSLFV